VLISSLGTIIAGLTAMVGVSLRIQPGGIILAAAMVGGRPHHRGLDGRPAMMVRQGLCRCRS